MHPGPTKAARCAARLARQSLVLFCAALMALAGSVTAAPTPAAAAGPKVVIVVGPASSATSSYRSRARAYADEARSLGASVVEVYTPHATWSRVKSAAQGARVLMYLGHGNGWPSPYTSVLTPGQQDGFGLNPSDGSGTSSPVQYIGESTLGSEMNLAPGAIVLLNHLCYASGLSEPGVPEGTLDVAQQRVDNFAAGFIRAGAAAVIADAYASPTAYLADVLGGGRSIDAVWRRAPDANGHAFAFESARSPGFVAQMDPETATPAASGFTRSIVLRAGLTPADVRAGARGSGAGPAGGVPPVPSLVATGLRFAAPSLTARPAAGETVGLTLPFKLTAGASLPSGLEASLRWEPVELVTPPARPPAPGTTPAPDVPVPGVPGEVAPPPISPLPVPDGTGLIVAEQPASVVEPVAAAVADGQLVVPIDLPAAPGRYRLTVTLHDADGVAFDTGTQALLPTLTVRVAAHVDGAIDVAPVMTLTAGSAVDLPIRVTNLGVRAWGAAAVLDPTGGTAGRPATEATVVGWWLPTGEAVDATALPPAIDPGAATDATVALHVPRTPGIYTLVLDLVTPEGVSLMASGIGPTLVRITVVEAR